MPHCKAGFLRNGLDWLLSKSADQSLGPGFDMPVVLPMKQRPQAPSEDGFSGP